jgi:hypothetical protein
MRSLFRRLNGRQPRHRIAETALNEGLDCADIFGVRATVFNDGSPNRRPRSFSQRPNENRLILASRNKDPGRAQGTDVQTGLATKRREKTRKYPNGSS